MDGSGNPSMRLVDDPMSVRSIDCPYPPSVGSSIYPGQACYAGINAFNQAVQGGKKPGDPDFPIPACPGGGDDLQADSGGFPGLDLNTSSIDCGTLTVQYMPSADFSGCFPILQITQDSPFSTITPGVSVYFNSKSECESGCKRPQNMSLTRTLSENKDFCIGVPNCSTTTRDTETVVSGNRPSIVGEYSCFRTDNGNVTYSVLPPKDGVGCSMLYGILPTAYPQY